VTKSADTFILSAHGGLKIKHVKEFEWPSGTAQGVHAPFTHRILNGSVRIKHLMDTPMYIHEKVVYNYYTTSVHVENINPNLSVGDVVCKGEVVCEVGASGLNGYFHNHFTLAVGTANSEYFLDGRPDIRNNERNEFSKSVDATINPYIFLDNTVNEKNSMRYSVVENGDRLRVIVTSDFLEDHFNEISVRYSTTNGVKKELKVNLSTREGLPQFGKTNNRYDYFNDGDIQAIEVDDIDDGLTTYTPDSDIEIFSMNFGRSVSGGITGANLAGTNRVKDYKIVFDFKNFDSFDAGSGDYIRVKDIYCNLGSEINTTLLNYEDFDGSEHIFWALSPFNNDNDATIFNNATAATPNERSLGSLKSVQRKIFLLQSYGY